MVNIPIKLYYTADGKLFTQGNLNKVPLINKLSNLVYDLYLVTPIKDGSAVNVNFEVGDNSVKGPYPMYLNGREKVRVNTEDEEWSVYKLTISDYVLSISNFNYSNRLSIGFEISELSSNYSGSPEIKRLNYTPYIATCSYAIKGNARAVSTEAYDDIMIFLNNALAKKINNFEGVNLISGFTEISTNPSNSNYNLGSAYLLDKQFLEYPAGTVFLATETGLELIAYSKTKIDEELTKVRNEITEGEIIAKIAKDFTEDGKIKEELDKKFEKSGGTLSGTIYFDNQTEIPYVVSTNEDVGMQATNNGDIIVGEFTIKNNNSNAYGGANVNIKVFATNRRKSYALRLSPNKKLTLYIEDYDEYGNPIGATEKIVSYDDEVQFKINGLEYAINNTIREIEEGTKVIGKAKDYSDDGTIKSKFDEIENAKLNKVFDVNPIAGALGSNDYFIINSGGVPYKLPAKLLTGTEDHYKGDYVSYEALVAEYPTAKPGDYAFININDKLIMYIWDKDDNAWRETTTDKFVSSLVFADFQNDLLLGNMIVGKASNYNTAGGNIKEKFEQLERKIEDVVEVVPEGVEIPEGETLNSYKYIKFDGEYYGMPSEDFELSDDTVETDNVLRTLIIDGEAWKSDKNTSIEFCYNLVVNVNNMQFPDVKFVEFTYGNYSGKRLVTNDSNATIIDDPIVLRAYMKFMTGNDYIPVYKANEPLNVYLVTFDGIIYKMQYTTDLGLCAFYMKKVATQNYVDEKIGDINSILATLVTVEE